MWLAKMALKRKNELQVVVDEVEETIYMLGVFGCVTREIRCPIVDAKEILKLIYSFGIGNLENDVEGKERKGGS
jgi:hypothetical protein